MSAGPGQTLSATFTPIDSVDYNTVTATTTINVLKATPTITWANPADITYGTPLGTTQLDATASVPGAFTYTPATGTVLSAGQGQTLSATFTPIDSVDYNTVTATTTINVLKATPTITWANPADITYGTTLGTTQLDATSPVAGTFSYSPVAGTVLGAGAHKALTATFTPTDTADYNPTSATVFIDVAKTGTSTAVTSSVGTPVFGQPVTFTATVTVVVPGAGTPTGTVDFLDGATKLGTGTLSGGVATFRVSTLSVGTDSITASYGGDTNDLTSTGTLTGGQTVNQSQTTTSVSTVLTTSLIDNGAVVPFGQSVTLTATVTADPPSTAVPTGTVDFFDGATNLGTRTLNNVGTATFTTSTLAPGVHQSIKAVYSGDGTNFAGSTAALEQISIIFPVAGTGIAGFGGDGGQAKLAMLNQPEGVAVDASGNLYIADTDNNRIRKVSPNGIITTVAGNGIAGFGGDNGPASQAQLNHPEGVAVDASGNLYIADTGNNRIRKVSPNGIITTVAGTGIAGFSGDGGPATQAQLNQPEGVAVDASGNLFIADTDNDRIREVRTDGVIVTVAGNDGLQRRRRSGHRCPAQPS